MHRILLRQLHRHFGGDVPDDPRWRAFVADVDAAYREADSGRGLLERSLELTSEELFERNQALHEAMSGADIGTWALDLGAHNMSLQGFPLPCVPDSHRKIVIATDVFLAAIDPADRDRVTAELTATLGERVSIRFWVDDVRGRRWLELRGRRSSSATGYVGICTNVTHEHLALEQKALLRTVIDTAPNLIFTKDRDGAYTLVNAASADYYGLTPGELIGKRDSDLNPNLADVERLQIDDRRVIDSLVESFVPEHRVVDPNGRVRWFQIVKRPLLGPDGRGHQMLGVATDVTERHEAEEERARLEEKLRQAQRLESLGLLAGGVAHDFNNLLTPILVYCDALAEMPPGDPEAGECIDEIRSAGLRARDLTAQLLAFGRKQTLMMTHVDLNTEVERMRAMLVRVLPAHIELELDCADDLPHVLADRTQMHQILMNLAVNARDAMPAGGRLRFMTRVDRENARVVLTVADTGHGMDAETKAKVFEPFFTTKALGHGTGLGLATVYGAVQQHAGAIEVESTPGVGTAFVIRLPAVARPTSLQSLQSLQLTAPPRATRATILVVEDDPRVLRLVCTLLQRRHLDVLSAAHPQQGLELARGYAGTIDLLISDVIMPGMNGVELHHQLVQERGAVPVLYITGYAQDVLGTGGQVRGDERILRKPFSAKELLMALDEVLANSPSAVASERSIAKATR